MTKKMEKLFSKFERRIRMYYEMYLDGVFDSEKIIKIFHEMEKEFDAMRSGMYNYDLISQKEYISTSTLAMQIVIKYENLVIGI